MLFGRRKKQEPAAAPANIPPELLAAHLRYAQENMAAMSARGLQGIPLRGKPRFGAQNTVSLRNCPACGVAVQFQAKFCHACGKPIPEADLSAPPGAVGGSGEKPRT